MFCYSLAQLQQHNVIWCQSILNNAHQELPKWDAAFREAQIFIAMHHEADLSTNFQIKTKCHVRFVHIPDPRFKQPFPNHDQIGQFREVKGTVVRMSEVKLLEVKRELKCLRCNTKLEIEADYSLMYRFDVPKKCTKAKCKGVFRSNHSEPTSEYCINFQELKIQVKICEN